MPKRRANGEGNIRKRKDERWKGRYTAGYDANGKAITKNVLGRTQAEVKDKLRNAIEDSKKLDPVKAGSYTLEQWLKLWYSVYVEPQVRYSTKEFYHNAIDHHIIPKLGSVKLEKLTMLQIQQFYNELLKSGRVQKKNQPELKEHGLSPRMVQCVHVVLNKALEYAVEEKLILVNPAKKCKIPKNTYNGQSDEVGTVAVKAVLIVNDRLSDEQVKKLTQLVFDNAQELQLTVSADVDITLEKAVEGVKIPFHKGAAEYYSERGITVKTAG